MNNKAFYIFSVIIIIFFSIIIYLLIDLKSNFYAQEWSHPFPKKYRHNRHENRGLFFIKRLRSKLDLSDEQYKKLIEINKGNEKQRMAYRKNFRDGLKNLEVALLSDKYDEKNIRRILEDLDKIKREERLLNIRERFDMKKYLNKEQKAKMHRFLKRRFSKKQRKFDFDRK